MFVLYVTVLLPVGVIKNNNNNNNVRRVARESMFVESHGDRPFAPNYLVLVTDGRSNNRTLTWYEAMATRAQEITIVAVSRYQSENPVVIRC